MHAGYGLVYSMLNDTTVVSQAIQRLLQVVCQFLVIEM